MIKNKKIQSKRRVCVAPMIDCTDQYFRQFIRQISSEIYLYTEMITSHALIHGGNLSRLLSFDAIEHPVALQVGGSDPVDLATVSKFAQEYGYDEVNLNVGCPSPRVQAGRFGACLMKEPDQVARCVEAMASAVDIPITIKTRIGVDDMETYESFYAFIHTVKQAGCNVFIVHARKALLKGLSPKQNRTIPELKYEFAHQIKKDFPELEIIVNGGIKDLDEGDHFSDLDGIMIGREAYSNPYHLINVDQNFYGKKKNDQSRFELLKGFSHFAQKALLKGLPMSVLLKHIYGLSHGIKGGSLWRRQCAELVQNQSKKELCFSDFIEIFPREDHR